MTRANGGKPGRQLTYRPEAAQRVIAALKAGAAMDDAIAFAGLSRRTFYRWLKAGRLAIELPKDRGADKRFEQLARDVDQAAGESKVALVGLLRRAAEGTKASPGQPARHGDWKAAEALIRIRADDRKRRLECRKLEIDIRIAKKREEGTLPAEKHDVTQHVSIVDARAELAARLAQLAPAAPAGDPGGGDREPAAGDGGSAPA